MKFCKFKQCKVYTKNGRVEDINQQQQQSDAMQHQEYCYTKNDERHHAIKFGSKNRYPIPQKFPCYSYSNCKKGRDKNAEKSVYLKHFILRYLSYYLRIKQTLIANFQITTILLSVLQEESAK